MSKCAMLVVVLCCAVIISGQDRKYQVGRAATPAEIRSLNITVKPDGAGLPAGRGSASEGKALYLSECASCHGANGEGGAFMALAGGVGRLKSDKPSLTVGSYWPYSTTLWDYINRAMPYERPGTLSADDVYKVTSYVLFLNKLVKEEEVMNAATLPRVKMPNREGFVADPRPDVGNELR